MGVLKIHKYVEIEQQSNHCVEVGVGMDFSLFFSSTHGRARTPSDNYQVIKQYQAISNIKHLYQGNFAKPLILSRRLSQLDILIKHFFLNINQENIKKISTYQESYILRDIREAILVVVHVHGVII